MTARDSARKPVVAEVCSLAAVAEIAAKTRA